MIFNRIRKAKGSKLEDIDKMVVIESLVEALCRQIRI